MAETSSWAAGSPTVRRSSGRGLVAASWACLIACAPSTGPPPSSAEPAVHIPAAPETHETDPADPPDPVRRPPPTPATDPFEYFVGAWDGIVNDTLETQLLVEPGGQFTARSKPNVNQRACELNGRFRAERTKVFLEVAESTCSVQSVGTTLERSVHERTPDGFTVVSPAGDLRIVYRRVKGP